MFQEHRLSKTFKGNTIKTENANESLMNTKRQTRGKRELMLNRANAKRSQDTAQGDRHRAAVREHNVLDVARHVQHENVNLATCNKEPAKRPTVLRDNGVKGDVFPTTAETAGGTFSPPGPPKAQPNNGEPIHQQKLSNKMTRNRIGK